MFEIVWSESTMNPISRVFPDSPTAAEEELAAWLTTHASCLGQLLTPEELAKALPDEGDWADEFTSLTPESVIRADTLHELCDYVWLYPEDGTTPRLVCDYCAAVILHEDESSWDYAEDEAGLAACHEWVEAQGQLALVGGITVLGPHTCEACGQEAYDAPGIILAAN